jgi:hypothetical protein
MPGPGAPGVPGQGPVDSFGRPATPAPTDLGPAPAEQADLAGFTQLEAADADVIEPEWIERVKHVIATTKNDPHRQVREINMLKADYMKKRYNKDIKLPDA